MNRIRTDLALEIKESLPDEEIIDGVELITKNYKNGKIKETIINITNPKGAITIGKPIGTYITIESKMLRETDSDIYEPIVSVLHKTLKKFIGNKNKIMVVGLGNREVTPDSLGPKVIDNLYITRHLLREGIVKDVKEVSAICPGVMAQTGMETQALLKSICRDIRPDIVIVVDALAAVEAGRLNSTIQICDTGISPGSGVGNNRSKINEETIGVKVIALGVPTVISMSALLGQFDIDTFDINPDLVSMFVTPKNIDESVKRVSFTISEAINRFLEF